MQRKTMPFSDDQIVAMARRILAAELDTPPAAATPPAPAPAKRTRSKAKTPTPAEAWPFKTLEELQAEKAAQAAPATAAPKGRVKYEPDPMRPERRNWQTRPTDGAWNAKLADARFRTNQEQRGRAVATPQSKADRAAQARAKLDAVYGKPQAAPVQQVDAQQIDRDYERQLFIAALSGDKAAKKRLAEQLEGQAKRAADAAKPRRVRARTVYRTPDDAQLPMQEDDDLPDPKKPRPEDKYDPVREAAIAKLPPLRFPQQRLAERARLAEMMRGTSPAQDRAAEELDAAILADPSLVYRIDWKASGRSSAYRVAATRALKMGWCVGYAHYCGLQAERGEKVNYGGGAAPQDEAPATKKQPSAPVLSDEAFIAVRNLVNESWTKVRDDVKRDYPKGVPPKTAVEFALRHLLNKRRGDKVRSAQTLLNTAIAQHSFDAVVMAIASRIHAKAL